jgi:hypothetical protein
MRQKELVMYCLGVAAIALAGLLVPAVAWPLPPGAFVYLLLGGPYSLLALVLFRHARHGQPLALAGIPYGRLSAMLAVASSLAYLAGLLGDIHWLGYGGAFFLFLSGEMAIRARLPAHGGVHLPLGSRT